MQLKINMVGSVCVTSGNSTKYMDKNGNTHDRKEPVRNMEIYGIWNMERPK